MKDISKPPAMTEPAAKSDVPILDRGEIWDEMLGRVELMALGDATWDLSDNDLDALQAVLKDRAWMEKCWSSATREKHELSAEIRRLQEIIEKPDIVTMRLSATVRSQAAQIERLLRLLRSLEWIGDGPTAVCWRCCRQRCNGHNQVCSLDAALQEKP